MTKTTDFISPAADERRFSLGFPVQAILLFIVSVVLYGNTLMHMDAYDDMMVITQNDYVHAGLAGIPKILTSDAFASYLAKANSTDALAGGRYRPLSIVLFAVEEQLIPTAGLKPADAFARQMHVRHGINILLYAIAAVVVLIFLRRVVFRGDPLAAFIAAMLFIILPVHTEVVANVKSSDEILSLLFICLTLITAFSYREKHKPASLALSLICFFLALLAKEYAVLLIVLLPVSFYVLGNDSWTICIRRVAPYLAPLVLYGLMRSAAEHGLQAGDTDDVLRAPYALAVGGEQLASELYVLLYYVKLLIVPYPLCSDYSYAQLPYREMSDPLVWLSIVLYAAALAGAVYLTGKRSVIGLALVVYLLFLVPVSNLFLNIGAPMGERLIYHASLGFAILVGALAARLMGGMQNEGGRTVAALVLLAVLTVGASCIIIPRNRDWRDNTTLTLKDVQIAPNSALLASNAGSAYMELANSTTNKDSSTFYLQQAMAESQHAIQISNTIYPAYLNLAACYIRLNQQDSAMAQLNVLRGMKANYSGIRKLYGVLLGYYLDNGKTQADAGHYPEAIAAYKKALDINPRNEDAWDGLANSFYAAGNTRQAVLTWGMLYKINPQCTKGRENYNRAQQAPGSGQAAK